ncbi:hypothetical protein ACQ4PT_052464 [Festuca glaucescens]
MASLPVPDELVAEIFLRLPTPADLVLAAASCVSFRRVAAHRSFVRRFRKLHAPPLLCLLDGGQTFHPAVPPHTSAPAASAAALVADFSFLPATASDWAVQDSRDGRVLLHGAEITEMLVCDPLHRRYLLLPPIPDDLAASVEDPFPLPPQPWRQIFLANPGDDEPADETSFRVISMTQCKTKLFAFVFSSSSGQWRALPSQRWNDLIAGWLPSTDTLFRFREYSYGCFYWRTDCDAEKNMLVLDTRRMEFSSTESPPEAKYSYGCMVEAGENRPGMFVLTDGVLSYSIRQNDGRSWQKEKTISLGSRHYLIGSTERYLLLYKLRSSWPGSDFYTLDVKTFQLEKMCSASAFRPPKLCTYSNFPPSLLSLPTISSGVEKEAEDMLIKDSVASSSG